MSRWITSTTARVQCSVVFSVSDTLNRDSEKIDETKKREAVNQMNICSHMRIELSGIEKIVLELKKRRMNYVHGGRICVIKDDDSICPLHEFITK